MLKQGRKREAKGLAVLYFIIGLIILLIILAVIYFALAKLDYSDKLDPEATMRPYVEQTQAPVAVEPNEPKAETVETGTGDSQPEDAVDLTQPTEEPTPKPTRKPKKTPNPTAEPTPEPTPEPTALPADKVAQPMKKMPNLPAEPSENGKIGLTTSFVSPADDNKLMYLAGYGYVNEEAFDGAAAKSWLVITEVASGQSIGYPLTNTAGVSGLPHADAVCQNATTCDFEITLDVSQYKEGIYSMALVVGYKDGKKNVFKYYPFSSDVKFTVLDGKVVTPAPAAEFE